MNRFLSLILCLSMFFSLASCKKNTEVVVDYSAQKQAISGTKWYSAMDIPNGIVIWNFFEDSVEKTDYSFDGNWMHKLTTTVADITFQKDVIKVEFEDTTQLIPYMFKNNEILLKEGEFFTPKDIELGIQGCWTVRTSKYDEIFDVNTENEYNIQFDNGIMRNENAAKAILGEPGEYYYYGPNEGKYTIGDGSFETDCKDGDEYFFSVYQGIVRIFHAGNEMKHIEQLPGEMGYVFS